MVSKELWFRIELNPQPWAVGPLATKRTAKKVVPFIGRNEGLATYQAGVRDAVESQLPTDFQMYEGHYELEFYFWRKIDEYQTPQSRTARNHEADATNMQKATEDALQGLLYKNDIETRMVTSVVVEQSVETEGLIIMGIRSMPPTAIAEVISDLPPHLFEPLDFTPEESDNSWPPRR